MAARNIRMIFNVPATLGDYADEVLEIKTKDSSGDPSWWALVHDLSPDILSLPTGAVLEMDKLKSNAVPSAQGLYQESDWDLTRKTWEAIGLQDMYPLASQYGVRFRVKSGGVAGDAEIDMGWD